MRKSLLIAGAAIAVGLSACATPYQDMGFTGGVRATQITSDESIITARGNAYTDPDTILQYTLRKAAETTIAAGFDWFEVQASADRSSSGYVSSTNATAYGNSAYAFSYGRQIFKPGDTVKIRMFHGARPSDADAHSYDAHELLKYLTPPPTK